MIRSQMFRIFFSHQKHLAYEIDNLFSQTIWHVYAIFKQPSILWLKNIKTVEFRKKSAFRFPRAEYFHIQSAILDLKILKTEANKSFPMKFNYKYTLCPDNLFQFLLYRLHILIMRRENMKQKYLFRLFSLMHVLCSRKKND